MSDTVPTDYGRWSDTRALSVDWDHRARFAARFIRPGLAVLDIGCGRMAVEKILAPRLYRPADVVARDERTSIIDLNRSALPTELLSDIDLTVMLGVFEYLSDPGSIMRTIAAAGKALLCSYNATDFATSADRRADGWINDLSIEAFENLARESGFELLRRYVFRDREVVYVLVPPGTNATNLFAQPASAAISLSRPNLLLCGFFGRGNCGDEALLQVIYERFAPNFDIIISVEEHGAAPRFWDWYPYNQSRRIHQANLAAPAETAAGMIVGGGGLPLGFAAGQVLCARAAGTPVALAGTDFAHSQSTSPGLSDIAASHYYDLFDYVALRSARAVESARTIGKHVTHGADWALRLLTDQAPEVQRNPERALIVLREFPLQLIEYSYVLEIRRLITGLRTCGYAPTFMPFCPEDARFLDEVRIDPSVPIARHWTNPRRAKQVIANSGLVVSIGRLHPIVFAADTRTPVAQVRAPIAHTQPPLRMPKVQSMSEELGVAYFESIRGFLSALAEGKCGPSDESILRSCHDRLDGMMGDLENLFGLRARRTLAAS